MRSSFDVFLVKHDTAMMMISVLYYCSENVATLFERGCALRTRK